MILAVICEKGGVGKTTTAEALADGLRLRGKKVLAVDLDPQCNFTAAMNADSEKPTLYDVMTGDAKAQDAIRRTERGEIIPGDRYLYTYMESTTALREALEILRGRYDYIILDCPPSMGELSVSAIIAADAAIIPTQPELYCLQALGAIGSTISTANPDLWIAGILITRFAGRTVAHKELSGIVDAAAKELGTAVFRTRVRECSAIRTAQANQQSIFRFAPKSNAAKDYSALIDEFLSREKKQKRASAKK